MKYYNIIIQVDFNEAKPMPPINASSKPWRSVGYLQQFFCTESSKDKAKKIVLDYVQKHQDDLNNCKICFDLVA